MNRVDRDAAARRSDVPRACGDEPLHKNIGQIQEKCSPRLWG